MSQTKVKSGLLNFPDQTDFVKLPSGTTAQRPSSPEEGYSRYNTTDDKLEYWNGTVWQQLPALDPPTLASVDYPGNDLAADPAGGQTILINGSNFSAGISVEIGSTQVSSVTLNSTTQLAITSPALTAGDYDVTVTNLDATTITALDFISYNGVPSWVTASGSLGSLNFGEAISTISLSATEPDGGNVSYAVTSGALPSGLTLSSSGNITGTMPSGSAETTYTFTVTATDDENQSTDRSFTITGVVPFVPSQHFNTVTYTGESVPYSVQVGFKPDLIWVKSKTNALLHGWFDTLRPNGRFLQSNSTDAESSSSNTAFHTLTDTGFTWTEASGGFNASGNYVAWCWKAGGDAVTNTDGTITSQVSANTQAGFSIVTFTGNGTNASVGHGLGQKPSIIFTKNRSVSEGWFTQQYMYVPSGNAAYGYLNTTAAFTGYTDSLTDDTVMQQGGTNGQNYVSYCFTEVAGFSSFGSYVGNGSTQSIVTGFEPAFIMIKPTSLSDNWLMYDNKRGNNIALFANLSNADTSYVGRLSLNANGFTLSTSNSGWNQNGASYIYMAFAADPNTQVPTKANSFNTVVYAGNSTTNRQITGVGFQPDFVWIKGDRNSDHALFDSVRGLGSLVSNGTNTENNSLITNSSYDIDGFTIGNDNGTQNGTGYDYVSWNWKAGGTPYINTDGSITSVVSANPAAGFSIVSWSGNSTTSTIGHGLNSAPKMIISKDRNFTERWNIFHASVGTGKYLQFTTAAAASFANAWPTLPDENVWYMTNWENTTGHNYISYVFAEVAGFSKFGSYSGNGTSQTIYTTDDGTAGGANGFEPAFVMLKRTNASGYPWAIADNKRVDGELLANASDAERNENTPDFISNGFTMTTNRYNDTGEEWIYMAFANQF